MSWRPLLIVLILGVPKTWAAPLLVMVDPGHGGRDHGTVRDGVREADITLAVSRKLAQLLAHDRRFRVAMTRTADETVSLFERARQAKDRHAGLFVSIHVNSSPDHKAHGAEFYFQNQLPPDEESMFLAHKEDLTESGESAQPISYDFLDRNHYPAEVSTILGDLLDGDRVRRSSDLSRELKLSWRGPRKSASNSVRQAPFYVLSQMRTPSSLVELGFLTNDGDYKELTDPAALKRMAEDLYRGIVGFKDSMDKAPQTP